MRRAVSLVFSKNSIVGMKNLAVTAISAGFLLHIGLAQAQAPADPKKFNGPQLQALLVADDRINAGGLEEADFKKVGLLRGFIVGVHDTISGDSGCTPPNISYSDLLELVRERVKEVPQYIDRSVGFFVNTAITFKYSCLGAKKGASESSPKLWTGQDLKKRLDAHDRAKSGKPLPGDGQTVAELTGLVLGVAYELSVFNACPPPKTTTAQLVEAVSEVNKKNPRYVEHSAAVGVGVPLKYKYPCKWD